jgi:hypothetical protein
MKELSIEWALSAQKEKGQVDSSTPSQCLLRVCEYFPMNSTVFFLSISFWAYSIALEDMYQRPPPRKPRSEIQSAMV